MASQDDTHSRFQHSWASLGVDVEYNHTRPELRTLQWVKGIAFFGQWTKARIVFRWPTTWMETIKYRLDLQSCDCWLVMVDFLWKSHLIQLRVPWWIYKGAHWIRGNVIWWYHCYNYHHASHMYWRPFLLALSGKLKFLEHQAVLSVGVCLLSSYCPNRSVRFSRSHLKNIFESHSIRVCSKRAANIFEVKARVEVCSTEYQIRSAVFFLTNVQDNVLRAAIRCTSEGIDVFARSHPDCRHRPSSIASLN